MRARWGWITCVLVVGAGALGACGGGESGDTAKREVRPDAVDFCKKADERAVLFRSFEEIPDVQMRGKLLEIYGVAPPDLRLAIDRINPYLDLLLANRLELLKQPNVALARIADEKGLDYGRKALATIVGVSNEVSAACGLEPIGLGTDGG